jgi:hypothetical protein
MSKKFAKSLGSGRVGWLSFMGCGAGHECLFFSFFRSRLRPESVLSSGLFSCSPPVLTPQDCPGVSDANLQIRLVGVEAVLESCFHS